MARVISAAMVDCCSSIWVRARVCEAVRFARSVNVSRMPEISPVRPESCSVMAVFCRDAPAMADENVSVDWCSRLIASVRCLFDSTSRWARSPMPRSAWCAASLTWAAWSAQVTALSAEVAMAVAASARR